MTLLRNSPSGPFIAIGSSVISVFGRTGHVVAVTGDYNTTLITNDSSAAGTTLGEALEALSGTDGIDNESSVSGATASDALDSLTSSSSPMGSLHDTFMGGNNNALGTTSNANAGIGDMGWNWVIVGSGTGASGQKRLGEPGALGVFRINAGSVLNAGPNISLNPSASPPFIASQWSVFTWRARFDNVQGNLERIHIGVTSSASTTGGLSGTVSSAGFIGQLTGAGSNANYQTITNNAGTSTIKATSIPIDALFHDFSVKRVSATVIEFYIDGVLVSTHTSPGDNLPAAAVALTAVAGAISGGATTFIDVDDFIFTPN